MLSFHNSSNLLQNYGFFHPDRIEGYDDEGKKIA